MTDFQSDYGTYTRNMEKQNNIFRVNIDQTSKFCVELKTSIDDVLRKLTQTQDNLAVTCQKQDRSISELRADTNQFRESTSLKIHQIEESTIMKA